MSVWNKDGSGVTRDRDPIEQSLNRQSRMGNI